MVSTLALAMLHALSERKAPGIRQPPCQPKILYTSQIWTNVQGRSTLALLP